MRLRFLNRPSHWRRTFSHHAATRHLLHVRARAQWCSTAINGTDGAWPTRRRAKQSVSSVTARIPWRGMHVQRGYLSRALLRIPTFGVILLHSWDSCCASRLREADLRHCDDELYASHYMQVHPRVVWHQALSLVHLATSCPSRKQRQDPVRRDVGH